MNRMNKLISIGNRYVKESDWKVITVLKFCLFSLGLLAGTAVPEEQKKPVRRCALVVFLMTYVPLMVKLVKVARE